jgi:hypothetical protein
VLPWVGAVVVAVAGRTGSVTGELSSKRAGQGWSSGIVDCKTKEGSLEERLGWETNTFQMCWRLVDGSKN